MTRDVAHGATFWLILCQGVGSLQSAVRILCKSFGDCAGASKWHPSVRDSLRQVAALRTV